MEADVDRRSVTSSRLEGLLDTFRGLLCDRESGFQQLPGIFPDVALLEYGASRDQDLSARARNIRDRIVVYSTVDFNPKLQAP